MKVFTIGFTRSSAESFFTRLQKAGVRRVLDVRLNNVSQLAGFAKKNDLAYFLNGLCGIGYRHVPEFAPEADMLAAYRKNKAAWAVYEEHFRELITTRAVENVVSQEEMDGACLLCSEEKPHHCHRRILAEYLKEKKWSVMEIVHL